MLVRVVADAKLGIVCIVSVSALDLIRVATLDTRHLKVKAQLWFTLSAVSTLSISFNYMLWRQAASIFASTIFFSINWWLQDCCIAQSLTCMLMHVIEKRNVCPILLTGFSVDRFKDLCVVSISHVFKCQHYHIHVVYWTAPDAATTRFSQQISVHIGLPRNQKFQATLVQLCKAIAGNR